MGDHLGGDGVAIAGFFIDKKIYENEDPGEEEHAKDKLFQAYKALAEDQSWTDVSFGIVLNVAINSGSCATFRTWRMQEQTRLGPLATGIVRTLHLTADTRACDLFPRPQTDKS